MHHAGHCIRNSYIGFLFAVGSNFMDLREVQQVKHLGDITRIHNAPFVDCITFGSPCQDLSIAGRRAGLAGERSGLFMEAVRIIKEMREQSGGVYPTFAIWENVPGAFSSNRGRDFKAVLEELASAAEAGGRTTIPEPPKGKWSKAGYIEGDQWSIAWRTFDAQFWGVPQRRKRIALVVDFGGQRAGEILFERTGVRRDSEPSIPPWQGVARNPAHRTAGHDRVVEGAGAYTLKIRTGCEGGGKGALVGTEKASPILANGESDTLFVLQGNAIDRKAKQNGFGVIESKTMFTLNATDRHGICCAGFTAGQGAKANGIGWAEEQAPTLRTDGGLTAMPSVITNAPYQKKTGTLNANSHPGGVTGQDAYSDMLVVCRADANTNAETYGDTSPTIKASHDGPPIVAFSKEAYNTGKNASCSLGIESGDVAPTMRADTHPAGIAYKILRWIVRRITPMECERLQGYPDGWTDIGEWLDTRGKRHKSADGPRYKALGNSIALPQWWWIICKMAAYLPTGATLGSLFDGIGGFPLVWEKRHGAGTALWASEIEEFPIAVTKRRFPES